MEESVNRAPRYLEGREAIENPRMQAIVLWVWRGVWKKNIYDLSGLTFVLKASEKESRANLRVWAS